MILNLYGCWGLDEIKHPEQCLLHRKLLLSVGWIIANSTVEMGWLYSQCCQIDWLRNFFLLAEPVKTEPPRHNRRMPIELNSIFKINSNRANITAINTFPKYAIQHTLIKSSSSTCCPWDFMIWFFLSLRKNLKLLLSTFTTPDVIQISFFNYSGIYHVINFRHQLSRSSQEKTEFTAFSKCNKQTALSLSYSPMCSTGFSLPGDFSVKSIEEVQMLGLQTLKHTPMHVCTLTYI